MFPNTRSAALAKAVHRKRGTASAKSHFLLHALLACARSQRIELEECIVVDEYKKEAAWTLIPKEGQNPSSDPIDHRGQEFPIDPFSGSSSPTYIYIYIYMYMHV